MVRRGRRDLRAGDDDFPGPALPARRDPWLVGLYITAAYWFTASTSFANPAVAIARGFTDTFAGIRPLDLPASSWPSSSALFSLSGLLRGFFKRDRPAPERRPERDRAVQQARMRQEPAKTPAGPRLSRQQLVRMLPARRGMAGDRFQDRIERGPGGGIVDEMMQQDADRAPLVPPRLRQRLRESLKDLAGRRPIRPPRQSMMSTCVFRCSIGDARRRSSVAKVETARKPTSANLDAASGVMRFQGGTYQRPASGPNSSTSRRLASVHSETIASRPRSTGVSAFLRPGGAWLACRRPCIATRTSGSPRKASASAGSASRGMTAIRQGPCARGAAPAGRRAPVSARRRRRPAARAARCGRRRSSDRAPSTG